MSSKDTQSLLLTASAPPFWHCGHTVRTTNVEMLLALAPAAIMAIWHWGMPAARVMALAMVAGIAVEALCQKIMQREVTVDDFSAASTCLMFSFLLPASAPWWLVVLGATLAMSLGKAVFGGLGANPVNSALVGWACVYTSWPVLLEPNTMQLDTFFQDPLILSKYFGPDAVAGMNPATLLAGEQIGGLGSSQGWALLLGGLFLLARRNVRWEIPVAFFLGVILCGSLFLGMDSTRYASPLFHLCTGATLLCGFFLAPEWASSPSRRLPMLLYGLFAGMLVVVIRSCGIYADGAPFAVLLANLLAPLLDGIAPKPFGARR